MYATHPVVDRQYRQHRLIAAILLATSLGPAAALAQQGQTSATASANGQAAGLPSTPSVVRNADIIRLARQGMSESVIMALLQQNQTAFDTSADALIDLKRAGVTDRIMTEMLIRSIAPSAVPGAAPAPVLRNADIVRMTRSRQTPAAIVDSIRLSDTDFDVSTAAVGELKKQGVADAVVAAMLSVTKDDSAPASEIGSLRLKGPAGGEVFVDGAHMGSIGANGEVVVRDVLAGDHQLRVVVPNRPELRTMANVVGGAETQLTLNVEATAPVAANTTTAAPAARAESSRHAFEVSSGWGSGMLYVSPEEVRYQANRGARNFTAPCRDVEVKAGSFRMSLRLTVKGESRPYDFDVKDPRLESMLRTFSEVCGGK